MTKPDTCKTCNRRRVQAGIIASLFTIMLALLTVSNAYGHKIHLFCSFEGTTLHCEAYFSGGKPVQNSPVRLYSLDSGEHIASGVTSTEGTFSMNIEHKIPLEAVLDAGQGHRATWTWNNASEQSEPLPTVPAEKKQNPFMAITTGIVAIVVFFGLLKLWKRRNAA